VDVTLLVPKPSPQGPTGRSEIQRGREEEVCQVPEQLLHRAFVVGEWSDGTVDLVKMMFAKAVKGNDELNNKLFTGYDHRAATIISPGRWEMCYSG